MVVVVDVIAMKDEILRGFLPRNDIIRVLLQVTTQSHMGATLSDENLESSIRFH